MKLTQEFADKLKNQPIDIQAMELLKLIESDSNVSENKQTKNLKKEDKREVKKEEKIDEKPTRTEKRSVPEKKNNAVESDKIDTDTDMPVYE
jgi:hypothetical protein